VEAKAILEGIRFADRWANETHVVLETDCSSLTSKLNGGVMDRSVTSALVLDIKEAMERRLSCSILKIERDQNRIAHNLAHFALKTHSSKPSFSFVSPCIQDLVYIDRSRCRGPGDIT
jgi:hypothetical protein